MGEVVSGTTIKDTRTKPRVMVEAREGGGIGWGGGEQWGNNCKRITKSNLKKEHKTCILGIN